MHGADVGGKSTASLAMQSGGRTYVRGAVYADSYAPGAKRANHFLSRPWTAPEDRAVLAHKRPDRELAKLLRRSVRRCNLLRGKRP